LLSRDIAKNNGFLKFGGFNFGELLLNSPNSPMFSVAIVFHYTVYIEFSDPSFQSLGSEGFFPFFGPFLFQTFSAGTL